MLLPFKPNVIVTLAAGKIEKGKNWQKKNSKQKLILTLLQDQPTFQNINPRCKIHTKQNNQLQEVHTGLSSRSGLSNTNTQWGQNLTLGQHRIFVENILKKKKNLYK